MANPVDTKQKPTLWQVIANFILCYLLSVICINIGLLIFAAVDIGLETKTSHGSTLDEYLRNTSHETYECNGTFLMSGHKLSEVTDFSDDQVRVRGTIVFFSYTVGLGKYIDVHNHPGRSMGFSVADLVNYTSTTPTLALVVSNDVVYQLEAPDGWPSKRALEEFLTDATKRMEDIGADIVYHRDTEWLEIVHYQPLLQEMLEKFNLVYTVTPLDEWTLD